MKFFELMAARAVYRTGRHMSPIPAWLSGELAAAGAAGEPFPLALPNLIAVAANRTACGQPLADLGLTARQRRIARGLARARKKIAARLA